MRNSQKRAIAYYAHTMPGLEKVAGNEIWERLQGASVQGFRRVRDKNGLVLFDYTGDPRNLLGLRTTEDVFIILAHAAEVPRGHRGLSTIYETIRRAPTLRKALSLHKQATDAKPKSHFSFRVISRMASNQPYKRIDLQRRVEKALQRRRRIPWQRVDSGEDIEIWVNLIGSEFICGLRLSDATMRHSTYKTAHIPASLRPSVAAAMVRLSQPQKSDVFLDPMCGAGTILIERGLAEYHGLLLGGDTDDEALRAAAENIGPRHKPRQLFRWDACRLALRSHSVDRIVCNPPFGGKSKSLRSLPLLYNDFFREVERVLKPGGLAVILTSKAGLVQHMVKEIATLQIIQDQSLQILGRKAIIFVIWQSP
ncbi:MAG: methyltransferase [Anaerolineales bacterium]